MIQAQELRIGNWLHDSDKDFDEDFIVNATEIKCIDEKGEGTNLYNPIRITEEWLISFGFEKYKTHYRKDTLHGLLTRNPSQLTIKYTAAQNWVVLNPANRTIYLHSVHQLQNLYYALTGQELSKSGTL